MINKINKSTFNANLKTVEGLNLFFHHSMLAGSMALKSKKMQRLNKLWKIFLFSFYHPSSKTNVTKTKFYFKKYFIRKQISTDNQIFDSKILDQKYVHGHELRLFLSLTKHQYKSSLTTLVMKWLIFQHLAVTLKFTDSKIFIFYLQVMTRVSSKCFKELIKL